MNNKEALESLKFEVFEEGHCEYIKEEIALAIKALEKQISESPYLWGDGYYDGELIYDMWDCPNCGKSYERTFEEYDYCPNCGQKIKWKEEDLVKMIAPVYCKDCDHKQRSEMNLWCNIFEKIMPEDGYCCFGEWEL